MSQNSTSENMQHSATPPVRYVGRTGTQVIGICLVILSIILVYLLCAMWPKAALYVRAKDGEQNNVALNAQRERNGKNSTIWEQKMTLFGRTFDVPYETRLILIVVIVGALGGCIHVATSFASYVGNQRLQTTWVWWYVLRPSIGASLALVFYFGLRGGLLFISIGDATGNRVNPFGVAAIGGLVGMFSKQATDKLRELFDNLFRTEQEDQRSGKLRNLKPIITTIFPSSVRTGIAEIMIRVNGSGFIKDSVVRINGSERSTKFVSDTQLIAELSASDIAVPGKLEVMVFNPTPEDGSSNLVQLLVQRSDE